MEKHSPKHNHGALPQKEWVIFRRPGTQNWSVRFSLPGQGQIRVSLRTRDESEANKLAAKTYYAALTRAEAGLDARAKTVAQVVEEYVKAKPLKETHKAFLHRYVVDFCGRKEASHLTTRTLSGFVPWRKTYWITGPGKDISLITYMRAGKTISRAPQRIQPSDSTLAWEMNILRKFVTYCRDHGYVAALPSLERIRTQDNARPSFSNDEIQRLHSNAFQRIIEAQHHPRVKFARTMLYAYIGIMVGSGMRPTEAQKMKWGDVLGFDVTKKLDGQKVTLRVFGKNRSREFIPQDTVLPNLDMIWTVQKASWNRKPTAEDFLFADEAGNMVKSYNASLNALLEACNLKKDFRGVVRSSYSFRHYYITHMLNQKVDIYDVARNCGTSVDMIERFYSHVTLEAIRDRLRPKANSF